MDLGAMMAIPSPSHVFLGLNIFYVINEAYQQYPKNKIVTIEWDA
jgi:hypothetical protein